jgi:hypothetical protein
MLDVAGVSECGRLMTTATATTADCNNHVIRRVSLQDFSVSTVAGTAQVSGHADGPGDAALFKNPSDVAIAADGSVIVVCKSKRHRATALMKTWLRFRQSLPERLDY